MLEKDKEIAALNPYLVVPNVDEAAAFYLQSWGALQTERYEDSSGKVWYCVLKIFGSPLQLMETDREMGLVAKDTDAEKEDSVAVSVAVTDVEYAFKRAAAAGAEVVVDLRDGDAGGRTAELRDPYGHRWVITPRLQERDRRRPLVTPQVVVQDVGEAVRFWQNVVRAKVSRGILDRVRRDTPSAHVQVRAASLHLVPPDGARRLAPLRREGHPNGDSAMVTLIDDDVDALFARAVENGATGIVEPQDAFWGDRYAEFRDVAGLRVACCGPTTLAEEVVDPADLQGELNNFLAIHNDPTSPAEAIQVKNVNVG